MNCTLRELTQLPLHRQPIKMKCGDGRIRKFVPDLLYISADHQEAQMHMGLKISASSKAPCCICLCPKAEMGDPTLDHHRLHEQRSRDAYLAMMEDMLVAMRTRQLHLVQRDIGDATSMRLVVNGWLGFRGVDEEDDALFTLTPPDILHGLLEGLLLHFRQALKNCAREWLPALGEDGTMARLDTRMATLRKLLRAPGWRLPSDGRLWFSHKESFRAVEHEAVLQILPHLLRGVFIKDGVDWGLRTAVAMCEWWLAACRTPEITENTIEAIEKWTKALMRLLATVWRPFQTSEWRIPKFHNLAHFLYFIR
jgi:Plavaka transposase